MKRLAPSQIYQSDGVISLLATIFVSLFLIVVTVSTASLMVRELRQSEDSDQSIRAFYAAEAGVEAGILAVKDNPHIVQNSCNQVNLPGQTAYTCQLISNTSNALQGTLAQEEPLQLDLTGIQFQSLKLYWNQSGVDTPVASGFTGPGFANFPGVTNWTFPAVMEISAASYNNTGQIATNNPCDPFCAKYQTAVVVPDASSIPGPRIDSPGPYSGQCLPDTIPGQPYNCQAAVTNFDNHRNYIIRLRPRYAGTHYQIKFYACPTPTCSPLSVPDQFATIDVTGVAGADPVTHQGGIYRRVISKVAIKGGVATGLDYVLYSDTDICKNFGVKNGQAFGGTCPGLTFPP